MYAQVGNFIQRSAQTFLSFALLKPVTAEAGTHQL